MSITSLKNLLDEARTNNTYVIGFVVQGWEDACSFVEAAQETDSGIILQSGPGFRKNMPLEVIYSMFEKLGKEANVKVVPHLDHGENYEICKKALDIGFTSIMYDGSKLPFEKNLEQSIKIYSLKKFLISMSKKGFKDTYLKKKQKLNAFFDNSKLKQKINYYDLLLEKKNEDL